jgi:hypothetical protein
MTYTYNNESQMRQANPYLANHLATIAIIKDGFAIATTNGHTYQWRTEYKQPETQP